ncbi:MAG TPA: threonine synthase [Acidimicrobiales bacterium]|nr:threonine synthase [Acidimicrobiales bacterium]
MKYVSTRGTAPALDFGDVLLRGLASDGGLYVPDEWPRLDAPVPSGYADAASHLMWPYVEGSIDRSAFDAMVSDSYATFDHPDVCPLVPLDDDVWLLELFHGPTFSFKDVALQLVGRLFDHELTKRDERATIIVATSGDTGSAAIHAALGRERIDVVVLHPAGRVSDIQRRQMTTVDAPNVHNVAIDGTFDDCQDLVKAMFADDAFRAAVGQAAMNSINWARVMAQTVYYRTTTEKLGPCGFAVPTGNFGNVFSAWVARTTGAPIAELVIGSNTNDILARWLETGVLEMREVVATTSPAMDIQVSSNHERLLFELFDRDGGAVAEAMQEFRSEGRVDLGSTRAAAVTETFAGTRLDDGEVAAVIADVAASTGIVVDPHTAVGVGAARAARRRNDVPMVCVSTAHPAKFGDAVEAATGRAPELPAALAATLDLPEHCTSLPNDLATVQSFIRSAIT